MTEATEVEPGAVFSFLSFSEGKDGMGPLHLVDLEKQKPERAFLYHQMR